MNIYDKIYNKIINLRYDAVNKKIYKPILILSYIEYLKDNNCDFGTLVSITDLMDFISIYIERDELIPHLINDKDHDIREIKETKYQSFEKKIINRFREMPLTKIVNDNGNDSYFQTNLELNSPNSRKITDAPNSFKIIITENFDRNKMIDVISKACNELIFKITNIRIDTDIINKINNISVNEYIKIDNHLYDNVNKVLITPRKGQYIYRRRLLEKFDNKCALCDIDIEELLIASHAKPWSKCDNVHERLTSNNGLLLCANHDALFDKGLITFDLENNVILVSNKIDQYQAAKILSGITKNYSITSDDKSYKYITYHKNNIFKKQ